MGVSGHRHAPTALYPWGKDHRYHWMGGWVGTTAGMDTEARRIKPFASAGDRTSIARSSSPKTDTILTELPGSQDIHYCI
jgi:hypothetical protein